MRRILGALAAASIVLVGHPAFADTTVVFETGSYVLPMDIDYQDAGMLTAFGLVDSLLRAGVPISWCIKAKKVVVDATKGKFEDDFTASATDFKSGAVIAAHGYRGGPFVIAKADAAKANPVITAWQAAHPITAVHVATAPFTANVSRSLTAAPRISVLADGNQAIAFSYLNAAGIPDEFGTSWVSTSSDVLTPAQISGPTTIDHADGALFRTSKLPAFCEIMTMHWSVTSVDIPEVTAEMASFLKFPVHVNAECQAVNAVEGAPPIGGRSNFVTTAGFVWPAPAKPTAVQYSSSFLPFAQMDGPFGTIGGSEPAYALAAGSAYYDTGIVMVRGAGVGIGVQDVWMTGYAAAGCDITSDVPCAPGGHSIGKVSYLGGHQYGVKTPMSANPTSQGARLFLNSLYEAGCVTPDGQPKLTLTKIAPLAVASSGVTYTLNYKNSGAGPALDVVLTDLVPAGTSFVSATGGGTLTGSTVTWTLGDVPASSGGSVSFSVKLGSAGTYLNTASGSYTTGLARKSVTSNTTSTSWVSCVRSSDCTAPLVCDGASFTCVECTPLEPSACVGKGVCLASLVCGCTTDADCGGLTSGRVCDGTVSKCIDGCRGTGGNRCSAALVCTSATTAIGTCVTPVADAGPDASVDAAADAAGTTDSAVAADSSTASDTAVSPDTSFGDVSSTDTSFGDAATTDAPIVPGGVGSPCDVATDCTAPLICDPIRRVCVDPSVDAGSAPDTSASDAAAGSDATLVDGASETAADAGTTDAPAADGPGGPGSPCTVDGDCTTPLVCAPGGACADPDGGVDGSSDAGSDDAADATSDDASDGATPSSDAAGGSDASFDANGDDASDGGDPGADATGAQVGGCGCHVAEEGGSNGLGYGLGIAVAGVAAARSRRRRRLARRQRG